LYTKNNKIIILDEKSKNINLYDNINNTLTKISLSNQIKSSRVSIIHNFDDINNIYYFASYDEDKNKNVMFSVDIEKLNPIPVKLGIVPFFFTSFGVLNSGQNFVFFSPMQVYEDKESILITDNSFKITAKCFKLPQIVKNQNLLTSNSFKVIDNKIYLNPVLSDDILEISSEGIQKTIFKGYSQETFLTKQLKIPNNDLNFYIKNDKINYFFISDKYFYLSNIYENKEYLTIYERKTGRAVKFAINSNRLTNLGDVSFDILAQKIHSTHKDQLISFIPLQLLTKTINSYKSFNPNFKIQDNLSKNLDRNVLHIFNYNFEHLIQFKNTESASLIKLMIYPSVVQDIINIKISQNENNKIRYALHNNLGLEVMKGDLNVSDTKLDISTLSSGIYYIKCTDGKKYLETKQFIKG
jgi:hypothetical protein